jgi:transcriptional regulator with XRE-family HTH domain
MTTFADRFIAATSGLPRDQVAERLGCTMGYVSQIATGHRVPTLDKTYSIAVALGVDPATLDPRLASTVSQHRRKKARSSR